MKPEQREELKALALKVQPDYSWREPWEDYRREWEAAATPAAILSLIAQVEALTVPQGWKLVPIEPTRDMCLAGAKHTTPEADDEMNEREAYFIGLGRAACAYMAMLPAAPTIPAIPGTKEGA